MTSVAAFFMTESAKLRIPRGFRRTVDRMTAPNLVMGLWMSCTRLISEEIKLCDFI
jgi:hypothetical protein